jgi:DNA replication protein DnaC
MSSKRGVPVRENLSVKNLLLRGVPSEYIDLSLQDYKQASDTKETIKRYLEYIHDMYENRVCLCFYGANGTGKSFLASLIVKEAYRCRYLSAMITLSKLMELKFNNKKTEEDFEKLNIVNLADFLVIDEVGKENFTKAQSNISLLEEVLRQADNKGQVIIICTNLPIEDRGDVKGLYSQYGKSIASLIEGQFMKVEFADDDYRHKILMKNKGIKILLGEEED